jgi:hypothetical protein
MFIRRGLKNLFRGIIVLLSFCGHKETHSSFFATKPLSHKEARENFIILFSDPFAFCSSIVQSKWCALEKQFYLFQRFNFNDNLYDD